MIMVAIVSMVRRMTSSSVCNVFQKIYGSGEIEVKVKYLHGAFNEINSREFRVF